MNFLYIFFWLLHIVYIYKNKKKYKKYTSFRGYCFFMPFLWFLEKKRDFFPYTLKWVDFKKYALKRVYSKMEFFYSIVVEIVDRNIVVAWELIVHQPNRGEYLWLRFRHSYQSRSRHLFRKGTKLFLKFNHKLL